jgi:signal transduction histidine kinase
VLKNFDFSITSYTAFRLFLLLICLIAAILLFRIQNFAERFLAWGVLMLFIFGLISISFSLGSFNSHSFNHFFDLRMPIYQLGIILELVFFTTALLYKTTEKNKLRLEEVNQLRIENERKELAKSIAVLDARDRERQRIAQEIHDDIGSGLTNIRLLSEIAIAKEQKQVIQKDELKKISGAASELIENMNEIVWSLNSQNDKLHNLIAYLRRYVLTYFENYDFITVRTKTPNLEQDIDIKGDFRRSIFLAVKECLHNIIKHANATEVGFEVDVVGKEIQIKIIDNGKGFGIATVNPFSNGLRNMQDRIEMQGGILTITSSNGTTIEMKAPY